jgi:D-amino-acid dehydrogenase
MKIAVIGAGVIGVTTAYELALQNHDVSIFESNSSAAELCSFANAGVVSPGYTTPWAKPGMALHVLTHLWQRHTPARIGHLGWRELSWLWQWQKACDSTTFARNRGNLLRLASYSQQRLQALTNRLNLDYERAQGLLVLLRGERERQLTQASLQVMRDAGISVKTLSPEQARLVEPALNPETPFLEALHFADDEVSNSRQFTLMLKQEAEAIGVKLHLNARVQPLLRSQPTTIRLSPDDAGRSFDAVVVCAGLASASLLAPLGLRIPLTAVYGYSASAAVREHLDAPRSGVMDERYKVAISRLGQRVRVSGGAEIGGHASQHHAGSIKTLYKVLDDWFPGAARTQDNVQIWKGARPMLPDGPPIVGASGVRNIWLNLGHGSSGWALACGSARVVADSISGHKPEIDLSGLGIERLGRTR